MNRFKIDLVNTGIFGLDGGAMFGVAPKAIWSQAYHPGDELNRIPLSARPLLVRWEGHNLLIDTGCGNKMNDKLTKIYSIDRERSSIVNALSYFKLKPDDITDVILTHLHFDHCGGATIIENGKPVPTFPNAKHYIQDEHLKWAESPVEKDRASFIKDDFMPLLENGLMDIIDHEGEIFPGISVKKLYGHTKAMQMVRIENINPESKSQPFAEEKSDEVNVISNSTLLYCADIIPTSAHIHVPYVLSYDNYPLTTIEEKKALLDEVTRNNWILVFEHDAFAQAATVKLTEKGYTVKDKYTITNYD